MSIFRTDSAVVLFEKSLHSLAVELSELYPEIRSELEQLTGWKIDFQPVFVLLKHRNFISVIGTKGVVAVAVNPDHRIIIDASRMDVRPFTLPVTVKHELAHLLLHDKISAVHLPRWLNEGFAQWVSDGVSEIITGDRTYIAAAVLRNHLIPLKELTWNFPQDEMRMILAYEQSISLAEFINRQYGNEMILSILRDMANGKTAEEAILRNLSVSVDMLEQNWQNALKKRTTRFYYLSVYLYEILFSMGAALVIAGFVRYRIRKSKYPDDDEEPM